jgi:hypothetical protein
MGKNNIKKAKHRKQELIIKPPAPISTSETLIEFRYATVDEVVLKEKVGCAWALLNTFIKKCVNDFASMRWSEVEKAKKIHHDIPIEDINRYYQERLHDLIDKGILQSDYPEKLFRFRLEGKKRIFGIREGARFHVIWFDPEHDVVPSKLKHT